MTCWYCHYGWPKPVADIYHAAVAALKDIGSSYHPLHFGPAHIVWEDENFDCAQACLDTFEEYRGDYSDEELAIVRQSLEALAVLPDAAWGGVDAVVAAYENDDDADIANYPPPPGVEMVQIRI